MVKLVAPEPAPEAPVIAGGLRGGAVGLRYFTFSIDGIDELMEELVANGVTVTRAVTEMAPGVRTRAGGGSRRQSGRVLGTSLIG